MTGKWYNGSLCGGGGGHLEVIVYSEFHIKHRCDGASKITSAATVLRGKRTRPEAQGATAICTCEITCPEDTAFILRTIFEEENGQIRDTCRVGAGMLQSLNTIAVWRSKGPQLGQGKTRESLRSLSKYPGGHVW